MKCVEGVHCLLRCVFPCVSRAARYGAFPLIGTDDTVKNVPSEKVNRKFRGRRENAHILKHTAVVAHSYLWFVGDWYCETNASIRIARIVSLTQLLRCAIAYRGRYRTFMLTGCRPVAAARIVR